MDEPTIVLLSLRLVDRCVSVILIQNRPFYPRSIFTNFIPVKIQHLHSVCKPVVAPVSSAVPPRRFPQNKYQSSPLIVVTQPVQVLSYGRATHSLCLQSRTSEKGGKIFWFTLDLRPLFPRWDAVHTHKYRPCDHCCPDVHQFQPRHGDDRVASHSPRWVVRVLQDPKEAWKQH